MTIRPARSSNAGLLAVAVLLILFAGFSVIYLALFYDPTPPAANREGGSQSGALPVDTASRVGVGGEGDGGGELGPIPTAAADDGGELGPIPTVAADGAFSDPDDREKEEAMDLSRLEQLDHDARKCQHIMGYDRLFSYKDPESMCSSASTAMSDPAISPSASTTLASQGLNPSRFNCFRRLDEDGKESPYADYCTASHAIWLKDQGGLSFSCGLKRDAAISKGEMQWYNTGLGTLFRSILSTDQSSSDVWSKCKTVVKEPAYFQITERRETEGNVGHEFAALYSLFLTRRMLGLPDNNTNTHIYHANTDAYNDRWGIFNLFSSRPIKLVKDIPDGTCFTNMIFPISASNSPYWTIHWEDVACHRSLLLSSFLSEVLKLYNVHSLPAPTKPRILWVSREDSGTRIIPYEKEIARWLQPTIDRGEIDLTVVQLAKLSFAEQVRLARQHNIMVASNGSGMMLGQFLAEEAMVVEVQWLGRVPPQFRNVLKSAGKLHVSVVSKGPKLEYEPGKAVKMINVSFEQVKEGLRAAVAVASGFGSSKELITLAD
ncbi:hypothetical protein HDU67_009408 [Dinochytrium kinnereticum]|nr:hypothetical protein HDU67_009408 [Dinochytrium kinnereticum]